MDFTSQACLVPRGACSQLPLYIDVRSLIYDFVGVDQDLANCRLICRDWKEDVEHYLEIVFRIKKRSIEILRPNWEELHRNMPAIVKETIEVAQVRKAIYLSFDPNVFYRSMRALAKINKPSQSVSDGVLAVMQLLTEEAELTDNGGALDWKFFKKKMLNRNFLKAIKNVQPEDISPQKVSRFEAVVGQEMVSEYEQLFAVREARDVYNWAINMIEYKEFLDTVTPEVNQAMSEIEIQKTKEREFEDFEKIVGKLNIPVRC